MRKIYEGDNLPYKNSSGSTRNRIFTRPPRKLRCAVWLKILSYGKADDESGLSPSEEDNAAI